MNLRTCVSVVALAIVFGVITAPLTGQDQPGGKTAKSQSSQTHDHSHDHTGHDHAGHDHQAVQSGDSSRPAVTGRLLVTLAGYSLLIACSSLLGGWLPGRVRLSHLRFQLLISLVGGLLLGIGVFHLLVHSVHVLGISQVDTVGIWMMVGILVMFFLLRTFHVHHHEPAPDLNSSEKTELHTLPVLSEHSGHEHGHSCQHDQGENPFQSKLSWVGLLFGLGVHTLLDGLALGAAMQADADHGMVRFAGLGVLLGIALHIPLDTLSITTLMLQAGRSTRMRWTVNLIYACLCPLGAAAFLLGVWTAGEVSQQVVGCSLAFSGGAFICISLSDLLPEMEFHSHNRWSLSTALLLGIGLAWAIRYLEPAHLHH